MTNRLAVSELGDNARLLPILEASLEGAKTRRGGKVFDNFVQEVLEGNYFKVREIARLGSALLVRCYAPEDGTDVTVVFHTPCQRQDDKGYTVVPGKGMFTN